MAERVELCLFDDEGKETRVDLPEREALVWHGYVPGCGPGQRYGLRVIKTIQNKDYGLRAFVFEDPDSNRIGVGRPIEPSNGIARRRAGSPTFISLQDY